MKDEFDKYPELDDGLRGCLVSVCAWISGLLILAVICALCSCSTPKVVVEETHDTLYISKVQKDTVYQSRIDSIWQKDSIYIREKGDTVSIDRWHTTYKVKLDTLYKYIYRTDTLYQTQTEYKTETVEVKKPLSWWQRTRIICGDILLVAAVLALVVHILKRKKWWPFKDKVSI